MKAKLANYFRAAFPGVAIQTYEEQRAIRDVMEAAKECQKAVLTWSATEGAKQVSPKVKEFPETNDLFPACGIREKDAVYVLRDVAGWPLDRDPILCRAFRDLLAWAPIAGSCIVVIGPTFVPRPEFEKLIIVIDYSLPGDNDLRKIANEIAKSSDVKFNGDEEVIRALSGLSTSEAENACALSIIEKDVLDPAVIYREKVQGVKKSGLLEIIEPDPRGMDSVGGLENLKRYIVKRKRAFTKEAREYPLDPPKGILLVGVPGTGKSLSAKAIGTVLGVPTIRLDIGSLFNSLVGESEARTRAALQLCEAVAPCVIWIDEIDKGFSGTSGSGANDSGVTKRVFGTVITWMQERKRPVYLVATANDVTNLPPEFLRKGRWDEIFAIDLPTEEERKAIIKIHLAKRNREDRVKLLLKAIGATENFTGSEIESCIVEAMFTAFDEGRDITEQDIVAAAEDTVPLIVTAEEQITAIRKWARTRARNASACESKKEVKAGRKVTRK